MKCDEIFAALAMLEKERGIPQTFMMDKIVQAHLVNRCLSADFLFFVRMARPLDFRKSERLMRQITNLRK